MKFLEAYEEMKNGKDVARAEWDYVTEAGQADPRVCVLKKNIPYIMSLKYFPNAQFGAYTPTIVDLEANDWIVKETAFNFKEAEVVIENDTMSEPAQVM